jgi:hypothetical protein
MPVRLARLTVLAVLGGLVSLPAAALAAPFAPATPISGLGDQPALAQVNGAALTAGGASVLVGTADNGGNRRAFAAFGSASAPPAAAHWFGPTSGAHDLAQGGEDAAYGQRALERLDLGAWALHSSWPK